MVAGAHRLALKLVPVRIVAAGIRASPDERKRVQGIDFGEHRTRVTGSVPHRRGERSRVPERRNGSFQRSRVPDRSRSPVS